jgi:hypothetical protein
MAIHSRRTTLATGAKAGVCVCTLILACSTKSSSGTNSSTTPPGATPTVDAGLAGCSPLQSGCFTYDGTYKAPATNATCSPAGGAASGAADTHCNGVTPQTVAATSCDIVDAGATPDAGTGDAAAVDAGPAPMPGQCGENGPDYGATMFGTEGDDDDCKYHTSYAVTPICENDGTYFTVTANYFTRSGAPLTGACTFAELCLNNTHPAPNVDSRPPLGSQQVVEGPPGTYTIGPVMFDAPGMWTVRFHFNEICCDVANNSPHGHAAFFVNVP